MRLPKFVIATGSALKSPVIMSTVKPFFYAYVWQFRKPDEYASYLANSSSLSTQVIPGYMIVVTLGGCLDGMIEVYPGVEKKLEAVIDEMIEYYRAERINAKPQYYKQFLRP